MESLTLSTPFTHISSPSSVRTSPPPKAFFFQTHSKILRPVKCSLNSSGDPSPDYLHNHILASSPRSESSRRAAESDIYGMLLRERIVFLDDYISDYFADAIISQLLLLDAKDPNREIRMFINSPGGSLGATMGIYDAVQLVRADVTTIALGRSHSTASLILGGGTKGKRFAMPNARIMIHQPLGGFSGQALDVEIQSNELMKNKENVVRIISEFTGRPEDQVETDIDRDRFMSPIEAVEYGIIDGVIDGDKILPLEPVPEKVTGIKFIQVHQDPKKFLTPEIPDDEIY